MSTYPSSSAAGATALAVFGVLVPLASGQFPNVHVVDQDLLPGGEFVDIPSAIAVAAEGDVLLLRDSGGEFVDVDGKSLIFVGDRSSPGKTPAIGPLTVANLGANQSVVVSNCRLFGTAGLVPFGQPMFAEVPAQVFDCVGPVSFERSSLVGAPGNMQSARSGFAADGAAFVQMVDCGVVGGEGLPNSGGCSEPGAIACLSTQSRLAITGGFFTGGAGAPHGDSVGCQDPPCGVSAGGAAAVFDATVALELRESTLEGGWSAGCPAADGLGLETGGASVAWSDSSAVDVFGNPALAGAVAELEPNLPRVLSAPLFFEGDRAGVGVRGQVGDLVSLFVSTTLAAPLDLPGIQGPLLCGGPQALFTTVLGASGETVTEFTVPDLPGGAEASVSFLQAAAVRPAARGALIALSEVRTLVLFDGLLENPFAADCNGNGTFDELEVLAGLESDCRFALIPDSCSIASGALTDANGDGVGDECDCNGNGLVDDEELDSGAAADLDGDGLPDGC